MQADERDATVSVVVDVANVMGSRPDGWWRDRARAASGLLDGMPALVGRVVEAPDGDPMRIGRVVAIVEGAAKAVDAPEGVTVVRAPADGDNAVVSTTEELWAAGERALVVTADRGLRARLPAGVLTTGPSWLNDLLSR